MLTRAFLPSIVLLALSTSAAFAADMFSGTWKAPSNTTEIISIGNGIKLVGDTIEDTGIRNHREFTAQFDTKDYPFKQTLDGKPVTDADDMVSAKKIDDYTLEITRKRQGAVLMVIKFVISKDDKTLTSTVAGRDPQGQPFNSTTIFEKQ